MVAFRVPCSLRRRFDSWQAIVAAICPLIRAVEVDPG